MISIAQLQLLRDMVAPEFQHKTGLNGQLTN